MKKKTILSVLICLIICSMVFVAVACKDDHEHTYDTSWTSNNSYHWHRATCGHSEVIDKTEHEWNDGEVTKNPTCTNSGLKKFICNICKTAKWESIPITQDHTYSTEWSKNVSYHWYDSTCGHDEILSKDEHDFDSDGVCRVCEYDISEDFTFELNSDNSSYTLKRAIRSIDSDVTIPSKYKGLSISAIGEKAFIYSGLLSINIPSSVTSIGDSAFKYCRYLINIEIPSGVTSIGDSAFYECNSLTSIEIPSGVTSIGDSAFYYCDSLTNIEIPSGVTSIDDAAFYGCSKLTSIEIPNRVTSIGSFAFAGCAGLTSVEVPDSVISIGQYAFNCKNLESIVIPFIGEKADGTGNTYFSHITVGRHVSNFSEKDLKSLKRVVITGGTCIYDNAFLDCSNLTTIEMPSTITSIGADAFCGCSSLSNLEIPSGVTSIGKGAFEGCSSLSNLELPSGVTSIEERTFLLSGLTSMKIPNCVTSIGEKAFMDCSNLTSIEIPYGVTSIEGGVFARCSSLIGVKIPATVTTIGESAFYDCSSLTSIEIPSSVTSIDYRAFYGCNNITTATMPTIAIYAIPKSKLETVVINGGTIIDYGAFSQCSSLTSIEIPSSVTHIGSYAFEGCNSLTVYCEAESQPSGWSSIWNSSDCPVVWGYKPEQ